MREDYQDVVVLNPFPRVNKDTVIVPAFTGKVFDLVITFIGRF